MEQTVYVDLFFLINFSMDFLCFFLTCQLLSLRLRLGRTLLASALGGAYAVLALFIDVPSIVALLIDVCVCVLMCLLAFGRARTVVGNTLVYIAVSMTLGGFMTALFAVLNRADLPLGQTQSDGISAWVLLLFAILSSAITLFGGRFFRKKTAKRYETVYISVGNRQATLRAFCDSGNMLRDPISGKACVLASASALDGVAPEDMLALAKQKKVADFTALSSESAKRMRLIPTRTATGDGMLVAMRVDKMTLGESGKDVDALLALCNTDGFGEECSALVPSELLM